MRCLGDGGAIVGLHEVEGPLEIWTVVMKISRRQHRRMVWSQSDDRPLVDEIITRVERCVLNFTVEHHGQSDTVDTGKPYGIGEVTHRAVVDAVKCSAC